MRKLLRLSLIITAILAFSLGANAKPVTAIQAIQRVTGNTTNAPKSMKAVSSGLQLVHTFTASATETEPMVYVFNRGANQGYVITPADDLFPAVLGYSDKGEFDFDNIPPAMKAFIEDYAREIDFNLKYAADELATTASLFDPGWEPVEPLMETQWNQDAPYNNMCPKVGSTATYTGCVATSMAQVMKYHEWPDKAEGSYSYKWNSQTLSIDFSTITFDWANMLPEYRSGGYNDTQANAVAQLMKAVGYSVDMDYGTNASGAISSKQGNALVKYFKYSKAVRYLQRDICSSTEFEKIIYDNLKEGLPVLYNGRSSEGGHSFVCDGYGGKHYFHFNWGWGGSSDGYFYLARLNPSDQGIGSSEGGYNSGQGISYNIRPVRSGEVDPGEDDEYGYQLVCRGHFNRTSNSGKTIYFNALNPASGSADGFWNLGSGTFSGIFGIILRDSDNNENLYGFSTTLDPGYGYTSLQVNLPSNLSAGNYTIHPAYRESTSNEPTLMKVSNGCRNYIKMTVEANGSLTFPDMTPEDFGGNAPNMMVNCFNYRGEVLSGQGQDFLVSVTNLSATQDYYGKMNMVIRDENGEEILSKEIGYYDVPAAQTIPQSINLTLELDPGLYTVSIKDAFDRELPGEFPLEITGYGEELTTDLQVVGFTPSEITPKSTVTTTFHIKNCTESSISVQKFGIYYKAHGAPYNEYKGWILGYQNAITLKSKGILNLRYGFPFNCDEGEYDVIVDWFVDPNDEKSAITISPEFLMRAGYPVETVAINEQNNKLEKDDQMQLTTTLTPDNATYQTLSWTSSDSNVVSVDNDGNIKALSPGTAYISASAHNGAVDHTEVIVKGNSAIEDIAADELRTVNAVYTISGVKILTNPTEAEIMNLDAGIYIFQTPKRAFTVKK